MIQARSSRYDQNERDFLHHNVMRDTFGILLESCRLRKAEEGFDRNQLGDRINKDKTGVSKLLKRPGNWTLRTLSDVANALDMQLHIIFCDRKNPARFVDRTGIHLDPLFSSKSNVIDGEFSIVHEVNNRSSSNFVEAPVHANQLTIPLFPNVERTTSERRSVGQLTMLENQPV